MGVTSLSYGGRWGSPSPSSRHVKEGWDARGGGYSRRVFRRGAPLNQISDPMTPGFVLGTPWVAELHQVIVHRQEFRLWRDQPLLPSLFPLQLLLETCFDTKQPIDAPTNQSPNHLMSQLTDRPTNQLNRPLTNESHNQPLNQLNQSTSRTTNQPTNHFTNETNQTTNRPTNQVITRQNHKNKSNRPTNHHSTEEPMDQQTISQQIS